MDEAGATRGAALGAVRDIEPAGLRDRITDWLEEGSMVPGVLTVRFARAETNTNTSVPTDTDGELTEPLRERAAGVQLIYEGLRLTRTLAHDEPWGHEGDSTGDLDVLVADVLVARGFDLLAKTEAAERAVETVRAFGRDQTVRHETGDSTLDRNLEADSLELAAVAGASLGEHGIPTDVHKFTAELATRLDDTGGFPSVEQFLEPADIERLQTLTADHSGNDGLTTSVDD